MIPASANPLLLRSAAAGPAAYSVERSIRLNAPDSAYLSRTPASAGNRKTFTISFWIKRSKSSSHYIFDARSTASINPHFGIAFTSGDNLFVDIYDGANYGMTTTQVFRDFSAWYHIVVAVDNTQAVATDRGKLYVNGSQVTSFSYYAWLAQNADTPVNAVQLHVWGCLNNIAYFADCYLAECYLIDGQALTPSSFAETNATTGQWVPKAYTGTYGTNGFQLKFADNSNNTATTLGKDTSGNSNNWTPNNFSVQGLLNYSSNVTTVATSIYNGTPATMFDGSTSTYYGVTSNNGSNSSITIDLTGKGVSVSTGIRVYGTYRNGMVWQINGSTVSSSGVSHPNTGWQTLSGWSAGAITSISSSVPSGSANEIYAIEVNGVILTNNSGAGNDSLVDTPTSYGTDDGLGGSVRGNYATLNPLDTTNQFGSGLGPLSNGNLEMVIPAGVQYTAAGNFVLSGKTYAEFTGSSSYYGVRGATNSNLFAWIGSNFYRNGSNEAVGVSYATADVVGIAYDSSNQQLSFYKNGTLAFQKTIASDNYVHFVSGGNTTIVANFGQRPFAFPVSGFKALCDTNLPEGSITTSGTFTGNANADGPFVWLNGVPTAMTINGNAVTFGTHADKLANGFKLRTNSTSYNTSGSNSYSITTTGAKFKYARAQSNP